MSHWLASPIASMTPATHALHLPLMRPSLASFDGNCLFVHLPGSIKRRRRSS